MKIPRLNGKVSRAREKQVFGVVKPTPKQYLKMWEKEDKLKMLQKYIMSLNLKNPFMHPNFLKAMDLHNKTSGTYVKAVEEDKNAKTDLTLMYITQEENDKMWLEKIKSQQKNLKMPKMPTKRAERVEDEYEEPLTSEDANTQSK